MLVAEGIVIHQLGFDVRINVFITMFVIIMLVIFLLKISSSSKLTSFFISVSFVTYGTLVLCHCSDWERMF
jgi:hypothetical protein